jgi:iron-sulfur cluster repair protein YtfE (RIC family)
MTFTIDLLDPNTRPKAPPIEGATHAQRMHGRRLSLYHAMHLRQMAKAHAVIRKLEEGEAQLTSLEDALTDLDMRQNYRLFGNICGQECQMLTGHHTIEDRYLFPVISAQADEGIRAVVDRLIAEHGVIHDYIVRMEEAAVDVMNAPGPQTFAVLREAFETLEAFVKSHFGYEEQELEEALGFYEIEI